jgi:hypothetical protein
VICPRVVVVSMKRLPISSLSADPALEISVVNLKFVEEQPQILRLTTPEVKDVRGPVRSE